MNEKNGLKEPYKIGVFSELKAREPAGVLVENIDGN